MTVETQIPLLDEILEPWKPVIGDDFEGYKNHVTRMLNFCFYLAIPNEVERKKLIIAAAFHDIGIWSDNTVDYLPPSIKQSREYLQANNLEEWTEEVELIIGEHHKIRPYKNKRYPLVEWFRQGDLVDFSLGMIKCGVPSTFITDVKKALPNAGFHKRLVQLTWQQIKKHPLNPAPMMKW
ncbi:HD domain-containing protein [Photobacterium sp. OFAV2-7]|uniref:HD domain-containing protein n=1 Tax=Photobacterium sp. OFAV2-7 TaxID=2917748 RepID=UPI001EF677A1|nr:HD domain-containing protein [Photobacterium sp. OFAV2-7]MCG7586465.1 HD domain-containing protein [Photobacterium sp. OFAV2-7]